MMMGPAVASCANRVLVLACGALARELKAVARLHELGGVTVECLPASLHNRPELIPDAIRSKLEKVRHNYDHVLIGYADCGTAGLIDDLCEQEGLERLPGAHCYGFFAGNDRFAAIHDDDPTAFYLTDFLVRHFERIVLEGLGITAHPELLDMYFGNYTRLIYLAQTDDPRLDVRARAAADALGLSYERIDAGYGELEETLVTFTSRVHSTAGGAS